MSRSRPVSRGLIGLLIVVIALGVVFYLNNIRKTSASDAPMAQSEASAPTQIAQAPVVSSTPAAPIRVAKPATQPAEKPARQYGMGSGSGTVGAVAPVNVLNDARAKKDSGDLPAARKMLNEALLAGTLPANESDAAKKMLGEINQTVLFTPKQFPGDQHSSIYTVKSGELLRTIAERHEITWELLARLNGISDPRKLRAGQNIKVVDGPFHAVVTKGRFTLDVYLGPPGEKGSMFVMSFPVGLGANDSTPVGTWMVETHKKLKNPTYFSPRGEGVIDADDPKNPLGERWIGLVGIDGTALGQTSYGIHGTIEPETIGKQASMGCIRMHNEDVELLFEMLVEGRSTVIIRE